jgi:hypothetical protein
MTAATGFTNAGTITIENPSNSAETSLAVTTGTLVNTGTINLNQGIFAANRTLAAQLQNEGILNVDTTQGRLDKGGAIHVNNGEINILSGRTLTLTNGELRNYAAVTVSTGGTVIVPTGTTFTQNGPLAVLQNDWIFDVFGTLRLFAGSLTGAGHPRVIGPFSAILDFGSGSTATGTVRALNSCSLAGDVPAGFTLRIGDATTTMTAATGFTNTGTITLENPSNANTITLAVTTGTLVNTGTISLDQSSFGGPRILAAQLQNDGLLNVDSTLGQLSKSGAVHINNGDVNIPATRALTVVGGTFHEMGNTISGGGGLILQGTTLFGIGTMGVNVSLTSAATLNPGLSPTETTGILTINGALAQDSGTTIRAAINGSLAGDEHDKLVVNGSATLNGIFNVVYAGDGAPCQGESYTVVTRTSGSGCFPGGITGVCNPLNGFCVSHNSCTGNQLILSTVSEADCNDSCREDAIDISGGFSQDCDWTGGGPNGIPDECDIAACAADPACGDCNGNIIPDACDLAAQTSIDCQPNQIPDECEVPPIDLAGPDCDWDGLGPNGIPDECDIADCAGDPFCGDCAWDMGGPNGIPDGCDIAQCVADNPACDDCNANNRPDGCDLVSCPPGDFSCADCNHNGLIDACDLATASNDVDGNGIPDECYPAALADPGDKTRFVSFTIPPPAPQTTVETAIRIHLVSLHHVDPPYTGGPSVPFTSFEGQLRWVGPPVHYIESTASGTQFYASQLQCAAFYQDWSTVGLLHVTGSAIVPSSGYEVENVSSVCAGMEESCTAVSVPLSINTTRWGDVEIPYNPPSTTVQPDLADISALVNKFRSAAGAPIKARALIAGTDAFGNINIDLNLGFDQISACVDAFRGKPYPHMIQACP